jgi:hypothetical protein
MMTNVADAYPLLSARNIGYQSNNQYMNFPANMNDGRSVVASWQPGAVVNDIIVQQNGIQSNWQYRKYLMQNSVSIRENMTQDAMIDIGYSVRHESPHTNSSYQNPKLYGNFVEPVTHRHAEISDLKDIYMNREQLEGRRVVPSMTQAEMLKFRA